MNELEMRYIEQYKKVDLLLCARFGVRNGMTEYIDRMDAVEPSRQLLVPSWRMYYRSLKHLRWLRNRIVHDEGESECERFDIAELDDFYGRLLREEDPLSLLRHIEAEQEAEARRASEQRSEAPGVPAAVKQQPDEYRSADSGGWMIAILITVLVVVVIFAAVYYLLK